MSLFVRLDTNWPDNPRVIDVGLEGAALHAIAMCLAKRFMTDGVLWRAQLRRYGGGDELIDRLIDKGLLERVDDHRVAVHDWLDRNPSREAIGGRLGARKADGKRGNHKRWSHPGDISDCPRCNPEKQQVVATSDRPPIASGLATRSPRLAIDRDRDRDIDNRDRTAADRQRALAGNAQVRALTQTDPDPDLNAAGTATARAALRTRETP